MRMNCENLIRIARETAQKRALADPGMVAAYLTGSLLGENPFLGNTTDIDIVLVHTNPQKVHREIIAITPEIHLDIIHNLRSEYDRPKELRVNPWLGPELYDPLPVYGTQHFFEFVQAGVRADYHAPANVLARARRNAEHARQIWSGLQLSQENGPDLLINWLKAVNHAANAIAVLNGGPLAERRFILQFPARAAAAGASDLAASLVNLLGFESIDGTSLAGFLPEWEKTFLVASAHVDVHASLAAARLAYYKMAFTSMLAGELPWSVIWPLILTWTRAALILPNDQQAGWQDACETLGLTGTAFETRLAGLDHFIDSVEEVLEKSATSQGL